MAKQQQPFGGGPRLGNSAPGEPRPVPGADFHQPHGGGKLFNTIMHRGEKAVNPDPSSEKYPKPYGGGNAFQSYPNNAPASGSGDPTGAGASSGNSVP